MLARRLNFMAIKRKPLPEGITLAYIEARCRHDGDCWLWNGATGSSGQPQMTYAQQWLRVKPVVLELLGRPRPSSSHRTHASCGRTRCCSPVCLEWRTRSTLMRAARQRLDLQAKWRNAYLRLALPVERVREIEQRLAAGESGPQIRRDLGVSLDVVRDVRHGRHIHQRAPELPASSVFSWGASA